MLMKRVWGHLLVGLSLLCGAAVAAPACVHNDSSFFVHGVLQLPLVTPGQTCTFTGDPTQPVISGGTFDVALKDGYAPEFLLGNQMVPESNGQQLQTETSTINVQGAIVRITDAAGNQLKSFTSLAAGTVYPASGTVPGYAPIQVETLDSATAIAAIAAVGGGIVPLVTYVKFFGNTLGGKYIESNEFEFPVDVCSGCLIVFSSSDINPCYTVPNCKGGGTGASTSSLSVPCIQGQDRAIDCSACSAGNPACNPPAQYICTDAGTGG
jgi:hypothetical protein